MIITHYGASCFKVQSGETVLVFDPPSKDSSYKSPRFQANIVLISFNNKDHNGSDNISSKVEGEETPFIINGPGEYEVSGVAVTGYADEQNTIYLLQCENISVCHLGSLSEVELDSDAQEGVSGADILLVPIRNDEDAEKMAKLINQTDAKIVIPMHYNDVTLKKFLKEEGGEGVIHTDKLTIKKKDLEKEKTEIVVLKPVI